MGCGSSAKKYDPAVADGCKGGSSSSTAEPLAEPTDGSASKALSVPNIVVSTPSATELNAKARDAPTQWKSTASTSSQATLEAMSPGAIAGFESGRIIIMEKKRMTEFYDVDLKDKLCDGEFGPISRCVNKSTGKTRLAKSFRKKKVRKIMMQETVEIQRVLDHPNLCMLYEVYSDKMNYYFIYTLCAGGFLLEAVSKVHDFSEADACHITRQVLKGVLFMHNVGIMHRDICPENIMVQEAVTESSQLVPKLIDFGRARFFDKGQQIKGNPGSAPDCQAPQTFGGSYSQKCDIWSCGVVLFGLLVGAPPFIGETDEEVIQLIKKATNLELDAESWDGVSLEAQSFVKFTLAYDESDRCSAQEALEHTWFQENAAKKAPLKKDMWKNMTSFGRRNKLHKAALNAVAQRLDAELIKELKEVFQSLDADNSGALSVEELRQGIDQLGKKKGDAAGAQLKGVVDAIDVNGSTTINYTEFIAAAIDKRHLDEEGVLWTAFRHFDKDGDGAIGVKELQTVIQSEEVEGFIDNSSIDRVMKEADFNGDGRIDFDEFLCMMRGEKYDASKFAPVPETEEEKQARIAETYAFKESRASYRRAEPADDCGAENRKAKEAIDNFEDFWKD